MVLIINQGPVSDPFLAVLKANPADDTTRLVYADWLDEHGEQAAAQYLRAVVDLARLPGGTTEFTEAAVRLYTALPHLDGFWCSTAGGRFDLMLDGYEPPYKIHAVKIIREKTGHGLAESKGLAESVPTVLKSWLTFDVAFIGLLAFHWRDNLEQPLPITASLRPSVWPEGPAQGAVFDVLLDGFDVNAYPQDDFRLTSGVRGLAGLLGITVEEARAALTRLPLTLASGLPPAEVGEFVHRVKRVCNVYRALPSGAIRVVPRLPAQEESPHE